MSNTKQKLIWHVQKNHINYLFVGLMISLEIELHAVGYPMTAFESLLSNLPIYQVWIDRTPHVFLHVL